VRLRLRRVPSAIAVIASGLVFAFTGAAFAAGPVPGPLKRTGRWITDREGRVVVLHGVDIVKKVSPYYPSNFGPADAEFLANEGLTAARIGFIWAGAEPLPGIYDNTYIDHVIGFNDLLAKYGIRTLIDVHQDDYGTQNETPADECSSDDLCSIASGDGAPGWAELGGGGGAEYADQDFEHFWDNGSASNGVGVQTQFVALWAHLVSRIETSPGAGDLLGLDPFNEPYPGSGYASPCGDYDPCPAFEKTQLPAFYEKVIAAMRGAGYRGVIFPEAIADSGSAEPSLPGFSDPQVAFNAHYYCTASQVLPDPTGVISEPYCASVDKAAFANYDAYAARLNVPYIVSEFGSNDSDAEYAHETDLMGSRFLSWMYWMYYNYSTDPGNFPTQGLLLDDSRPGSVANTSPLKLKALVEPYAQAIAGTPQSWAFDRSTNAMTLTYTTHAVPGAKLAKGAETQIFVPQLDYPTGYAVTVTGAHVTSSAASPWVELAAIPGEHAVSVTVTPRTGSSTELPSQANFTPPAAASSTKRKRPASSDAKKHHHDHHHGPGQTGPSTRLAVNGGVLSLRHD